MGAGIGKRNRTRAAGQRTRSVFGLCPTAHILLFAGLLVIAAFFILRNDRGLMTLLSENYVRPYRRTVGRVFDIAGFSVAEVIVAVFAGALLIFITAEIILIARGKNKLRRLYKTAVTLAAAVAVVYAGFCLLWGVNYYARGFSDSAGLEVKPVPPGELEAVARYFADTLNEYAPQVERDSADRFREDKKMIFERSALLYDDVAKLYPFLEGPPLRAKPMMFSYFMSYVNFTGFFFPFTGEANVNTDSPMCLLPATIAHELAHQRGVAAEDEANFTAVLSCMISGEPVFCYSAALLAYIHLSNALYRADREAWEDVYGLLDGKVLADIDENREYWASFDTKAAKVTEAVYTEFLQSYGQELGMQSYGACVDLLVAYFGEAAGVR
ncbi:MAG: DUF3810 domain-containing protein [Oscillospiraceae bacterium]|nr:DUF3810 domain-containing protein [Oscillospiraceae bacterium]